MEGETSHIVYSVNVIEFVTVANEYCATLETMDDLNRKDFVHKMQKIFPLLYLKASLLPEVEEMLEDEPEKFVAEEDYNYLHRKLQVKLGEHDAYLEACRARSPRAAQQWSHPAVYLAGRDSGWFFLANNTERTSWPVFREHYQAYCTRVLRGEQLKVPEPEQLEHHKGTPLSREQQLAELQKLKQQVGI